MEEEAPATKRLRYSLERDIEVVVEGTPVLAYSMVLMMVSPVFRSMLQSEMQEASSGRIVLEGKSLQEFQELLSHVEVIGGVEPPAVTDSNVNMLLRWADEYQMDALLKRCEAFLMHRRADDVAELVQAVEYRLERRIEQCFAEISQDVQAHLEDLEPFLDNRVVMQKLWPAILAGVMPQLQPEDHPWGAVASFWPLVVEVARLRCSLRSLSFNSIDEVRQTLVKHGSFWVLIIGDASELKRLCSKPAAGVLTLCRFRPQLAGKFVEVREVTASGNVGICHRGLTYKVPFSAILRPSGMLDD